MAGLAGMIPPAFLWYRHAGYRENWNRAEWSDPTMPRPFDEYMREAVEKGWWGDVAWPAEDAAAAGDLPGGRKHAAQDARRPEHAAAPALAQRPDGGDHRLADEHHRAPVRLRAARHQRLRGAALPHPLPPHADAHLLRPGGPTPAGEAKSEWEIDACSLAKALERKASERGIEECQSGRGSVHSLKDLYEQLHPRGRDDHRGGRLRGDARATP